MSFVPLYGKDKYKYFSLRGGEENIFFKTIEVNQKWIHRAKMLHFQLTQETLLNQSLKIVYEHNFKNFPSLFKDVNFNEENNPFVKVKQRIEKVCMIIC